MQILDANGAPIEAGPRIYNTFAEWKMGTLDPSSLSAWNHQELKLAEIRKNFAEAVCHGKEGLRAQIEEKNKTIAELKKFCEENIKIISELEIKCMQLEGKLQ